MKLALAISMLRSLIDLLWGLLDSCIEYHNGACLFIELKKEKQRVYYLGQDISI